MTEPVPEPQQVLAGDNRTVALDGVLVTELRKARGLSREQLADGAHGAHRLSVATIKRAESGASVYLETARRVAGLLEVPVNTILRKMDDEPLTERTPILGGAPIAVAVMPFVAVGEDPRTTALAHGLVEDLTTRLGDYWFPVISHASVVDCRSAADREGLSDELGVGYCVVGSVQLRASAVRVQARLLEAGSARQLWAEEYNRRYVDLFVLQDELTADIIDSVNHRLLELESVRGQDRQLGTLDAWEHAVLGHRLFLMRTAKTNLAAREHFERALSIEHGSSLAWYLLVLTYQQELLHQWTRDVHATLGKLQELSTEFDRRFPQDARAGITSAYALLYRGRRAEAEDRLRVAISKLPNMSTAYFLLGQTLAMGEKPEEGIEQLELALRLNPREKGRWSVETALALAHFAAERYDEAVLWAEGATRLAPEIAFPFGSLAASRAMQGDVRGARDAVSRMVELQPSFSNEAFAVLMSSTVPGTARRYLRALEVAGLAVG